MSKENVSPSKPFAVIESMTRLECWGHPYEDDPHPLNHWKAKIRVWREEDRVQGYYPITKQELQDVLNQVSPRSFKNIAETLARVPRVNAVEVLDSLSGEGPLVYPEWP